MIRCITIGKHITVQGTFVGIDEAGMGIVRVGDKTHVGRLV